MCIFDVNDMERGVQHGQQKEQNKQARHLEKETHFYMHIMTNRDPVIIFKKKHDIKRADVKAYSDHQKIIIDETCER